MIETNIYDSSGNRRRTVIDYGPYAQWGLPYGVREFAADGVTEIRQTYTDYNLNPEYLERRIIGLISAVHVSNLAQWQSKTSFTYDDPARLHGVPAAATQHDTNYNLSFSARGNVTAVSRWDVTDINNAAKKLTSYTNYYTTGTPSSMTDPSGHQSGVTYGDSFSDNMIRNTFAYPTTITDADNHSSYVQYNFDFGATTRTEGPPPAGQSQGAIHTMTYNNLGQFERVTTSNNGAYKRFWYGAEFTASYAAVNNVADELYTIEVTDGLGRVIGAASNHPGSSGGYRLVNTVYNVMGRAWLRSNPTEVNSSWQTYGDDVAGIYYTQQTYDWQGRPLVTTNPDLTTREASYAGCGCAGGEVVTLTDEGTINGGVAKRRQQRIYSDVLGRTVKTEILNWQGGSVYAATVNTYNARDQITQVRQYAGAEGSGTFQDTNLTYDGYGRLQTKHVPEQNAGTATTWAYNADSTVQSITDARGASTSVTYNNGRHLPNVVTHSWAGSTIVETFSYDAAGNRTSMSDSSGSTTYQYNQLSQMTSETRNFSGLGGSYTLAYDYHVGGLLKSLTDHTNQRVNYGYDNAGRLSALTGTNYANPQFINSVTYRAWGRPRQITYGNGRTESVTYNSRLKVNHYEIPAGGGFGVAVSIDYQYYDDGRLKYSHDLRDNRFDRSYEYDHVSRLTKALSGAEARGEPATNDRPYKETATYDAFDHLNVRSTRHWSKAMGFGSSDTYSNNRRVGWTYDANGNWLSGAGRQHTYDAAGRTSATSWTGGYFNQFYDGDGRRVKTVEPNLTTYYLRSTVLGGQVVEELTSSGTKQKSMIYGGQKVIGYDSANGNVSMLHQDPSGVTIRSSISQSSFVTYFSELDPWGAEVFTSDPYLDDPDFSGGRGESGPVYPAFGDISMPSSGCTLDGVYSLCDFISRGLNGGALALRVTNGKETKEFPIEPALLGIFAVWIEDAGEKITKLQTPAGAEFDAADVIVTNTDSDGLGHWELISFEPQNTQIVPKPENLRERVMTLLKGDCGKYVQALLNKVAERNPGNPLHGNTIMDIFDKIEKQGGYQLDGRFYNTVSGDLFVTKGGKPATVHLLPWNTYGAPTAYAIREAYRNYTYGALHETFHLAGKGGFSDEQLVRAAYALAGKAIPKYMEGDKNSFSWSSRFDDELMKNCPK